MEGQRQRIGSEDVRNGRREREREAKGRERRGKEEEAFCSITGRVDVPCGTLDS